MHRLASAFVTMALLLTCAMVPAVAQNTTGLVVSVCGTPPSPFVVGRPAPFTVDTTGTLCSQAGGGGGGGAVTLASGAVASGAYSSGSIASGAYASGSIGSGAMVDIGSQADAACGTATGTCSLIALTKFNNTATGSAVPAGTNLIGDVNLRQGGTVLSITNPTFNRDVAGATGGASTTGNIAANNTTAVVVKASAGTVYGAQLSTIGSVPLYLKLYNATSATCGSGTPVKRLIVPKAGTAADGGGSNISFGSVGVDFSTGITYCITAGIADNDTTAPAASVALVNLDWK